MGIVVIGISFLRLPSFLVLFLQVLGGVVAYFVGSVITKNNEFQYFWQIVKTKLWKSRK